MKRLPQADLILNNDERKYKGYKNLLKNKSGVYVLFIDTICVWIGYSKNLMQRTARLRSHKNIVENPPVLNKLLNNSKDIKVYIYFREIDDAIILEQTLIQELKPCLNIEYLPLQQRHIIKH